MRRLGLFDVLGDVLMPDRHRTSWALVRFLTAFVTLEWVIHASTHLATNVGKWLFGAPDLKPGWLTHDLGEVIGPVAAFLAAVVWIVWAKWRHTRRQDPRVPRGVPAKARGLISFLSQYTGRGGGLETHERVRAAAEAANRVTEIAEFRKQVLQSNWGPLCAAAQYHRETIKHCWLICTEGQRGSLGQFDAACAAIRLLVGKDIAFHKVLLIDASSVAEAAKAVESVYQVGLPAADIEEEDAVADFTAGTAAMTGGMILATVAPGRRVEYLRQGVELNSLTEADIENQKVLIDAKAAVQWAGGQKAGHA